VQLTFVMYMLKAHVFSKLTWSRLWWR